MKEKYILKLKPFFSKKIWGWEKWSLSCHEYGNAIVENGVYKGKKLCEVLDEGNEFPILVKIIKADDKLSIQVHPDDEYARKNENSQGKTECWYILGAKKNSKIILGINDGLDKEKLRYVINHGEIHKVVKSIEVKKGDFIYIPSGTVHSIGAGIKLIEVQQNSNITYRLHDWNRGREIHVDKSLDVIDYKKINGSGKIDKFKKLNTPYFTVEKIIVDNKYVGKVTEKFHTYTVACGRGVIQCEYGNVELHEEDTIYIPKGINYKIKGNLELIKTYI